MLTSLVLISLISNRGAPSPRFIADVQIGTGALTALEAQIGRGTSVVRDEKMHNDGWTYWRIRGSKDALLFVYWEPANPRRKRLIKRITIESFRDKSDAKIVASVDPKVLGFWGKIKLGMKPSEVKFQLSSLGDPRITKPNMTEWGAHGLTVNAQFHHGKLSLIAVDSIYLGLVQSMPMQ